MVTDRYETLSEAETKATELTEETGKQHVAYKTNYVYLPFQVSCLPQIGDEVSMGFNGDYYPCGKIVKISKTYFRITTDKGTTFTRVGPNSFKQGGKNGAFSMVRGVINERNPSF